MARIKKRNLISLLTVLFIVLATLVPKAKAWTETDFEIFDLVDALEKAEGKDTNFYNWLGVSPSATQGEISKAYRKLSLKWHPDKNKNDPKAKERFARLGVIVSILRDPTKRERYNFFYKNGVPRWRGTGYLYSRFRPGLGTVIILLCLIASVMQYIAGQVNYRQEVRRIIRFVEDARAQMVANAPKGRAPSLGKSFIEVGQRVMRCEVKGDHYLIVYPNENNQEPIHLNVEWVKKPTIEDVFIISLPKRLFYKLLGKKDTTEQDKKETKEEIEESVPKKKAAPVRKRGAPKVNKYK